MDHNKRKRGSQQQDTTNENDNDAAFMETLISPDFVELSSHFPAFRRAYRAVQQAQATAAATAANNDNNDSAESSSGTHHAGSINNNHNNSSATTTSTLAACMTQEFSIALTRALLHLHFGITLTHLPLHHLCPPVPNRFFFVQWLQNVLLPLLFFDNDNTSSLPSSQRSQQEQQCSNAYFVQRIPSRHRGLDIGTGATCIYPLLFAANIQRRINNSSYGQDQELFVIDGISNNNNNNNKNVIKNKWTLYATDTDPESIELAKQNVSSNMHCFQSTSTTIHALVVDPSDAQQKNSNKKITEHSSASVSTTLSLECHPIGPLRRFFQKQRQLWMETNNHEGDDDDDSLSMVRQQQLDFCMTNPPFYDDDNDNKNTGERTNPRKGDGRARTSMTVSEGSYPNGEVGFVVDMILDGLILYAAAANNNSEDDNDTQLHQQQHNGNATSRCHSSLPPPQVPGWSCCMCGKKASWVRLHHIVTQLLGPGHVMATEFGPGHLTRWFLAWTFVQPQMQSPLAKMEGCDFVVNVAMPAVGNITNSDNEPVGANGNEEEKACREVMNRLDEYCRDLPGWDLVMTPVSQTRAEIREATPAPKWIDDGLLPDCIRQVLAHMDPVKRMNLLPPGGHFLLDVQLETTSRQERHSNTNQKVNVVKVAVHVNAFQHSTHGKKTIGKITSQLEGEICRTNRRWRRKLKRQEEVEQHQQPPLVTTAQEGGPQPMDES